MDVDQYPNESNPRDPKTLFWDQSNIEKWTHFSPTSMDKCADWKFNSVKLYCPDIITAKKEDTKPDLLLYFEQSDKPSTSFGDGSLTGRLTLAIAKDMILKDEKAYLKVLEQINRFTSPKFAVWLETHWVFRKKNRDKLGLRGDYPRLLFKKGATIGNELTLDFLDMEGGTFEVLELYSRGQQDNTNSLLDRVTFKLPFTLAPSAGEFTSTEMCAVHFGDLDQSS